MTSRRFVLTLAGIGLALSFGQFAAVGLPGDGGTSESQAGPDVIVGAIPDVAKYGANAVGGVTYMAYAFGSTSCNIGTEQLDWYSGTSDHPVIPQNAYRIRNGRFEQIGLSWMKHGFCALQENLCGTCTPAGSGCPSLLGVGCSDPYTAGLNGNQGDLGPRYEVNPSTGAFPATGSTAWPGIPSGQGTIGRRVQIAGPDLDPALNAGAVYLAECQYIHPQDALNGNDNNNASYRTFTVGALAGGAYNLSLTGPTQQTKPAIFHWSAINPSVTFAVSDAADGRYILGCNAYDLGNGLWRYEYAVMNLNSDTAGASFAVPVPASVAVTNAGFKDVRYHSGEPYDGTDWTISVGDGQVRWQCPQTFAQNPNANALRWSTVYNFWFDANTRPLPAAVSLGLFKSAGTLAFNSKAPSSACEAADLDCNGIVNGADLGMLLSAWGLCGSTPCAADLDSNGVVNGADLGFMLAAWG
jgi:hypothetical protein